MSHKTKREIAHSISTYVLIGLGILFAVTVIGVLLYLITLLFISPEISGIEKGIFACIIIGFVALMVHLGTEQ